MCNLNAVLTHLEGYICGTVAIYIEDVHNFDGVLTYIVCVYVCATVAMY